MIFRKFSELTDAELKKIINKHYSHWSQYSPTMDYNNTKDKFENIYAKDNNIPFGIAMFDNDNLIGFLVFKEHCLEKYLEYTPWISDVMIFDEFRNQGYGKKMIQMAMKYAFEMLKAKKITLGVFDNNPSAYYCYKAAGFKDAVPDRAEAYPVMGEVWKSKEMVIER